MTNELKDLRSVYFIGIGGIGMSAIARYLKAKGVKVSGYDKTSTVLTKELEAEGIDVHYEENPDKIIKDPDLVVYTPAIPEEHIELKYCREKGIKVVKRSDILQLITNSSFNICVAGTHGKTTISTMIAHVLRDSGYGSNAFLGGIAVNYGTNFWLQTGNTERDVNVVEADEYDRSFLKLSPDIAVITAMDADHLDIYGTTEAMEQAFIDFSNRIKPGGLLIRQFGLKRGKELGNGLSSVGTQNLGTLNSLTYSLQNESADLFASNIQMKNGSYSFDVHIKDKVIEDVELHMGGMHNVENAVVAIGVASSLEIEGDKIKKAIENFRGVKRRFEYVIEPGNRKRGVIFIDDYAHHPEELKALIRGARSLFKETRCTVVFQPHLYSRTRDLANGFAEALDLADRVFLLPIYPAREEPIKGVSSEMITNKMQEGKAIVVSKEELMNKVKKIKTDEDQLELFITAGAGDIDGLVEPIRQILMGPFDKLRIDSI